MYSVPANHCPVLLFGVGRDSETLVCISVVPCSVTQSCLTLCDLMDCIMPGVPVLHYLPELAQTHVHWVGDAITASHSLSSLSPSALNLSQHQGLFQWVCPQSFPASGSFPMSQLFESGGQSIGASASALFLSMNIKGWFPLGLTDLILLLSKGLSSVFTLFKHWVGQKCSGFFCKMLWKNPNEFFCQTNIFSTYQEVTWSFDPKT